MAQRIDVRYVNFCTAGSSALKVAPAIPLKTLELPKKRRAKRITLRIDPVAAAGIVMAVVMSVLMTVGVCELVSARNSEVVMASYVDSLQQENAPLRTAYEEGCDLEDVERTALALGMVPAEQVQQVKIQVQTPATDKNSGAMQNFFTFLTGLFA